MRKLCSHVVDGHVPVLETRVADAASGSGQQDGPKYLQGSLGGVALKDRKVGGIFL